ncbi:DNA polymerase III subunit gamma/tau [candidate division KSB3 bacterium]|uniref:DNA polymerase III subunit gamma/tau n=1 Tax=candidate division KSB3 bacterium TaxID=2044937 RepID=A0A2G6EDM5_9BACT|nr:MAG: DNA polymerase III subunit gamma/tau [candidate division KSB3 bacterium]PIE31070.1 MAG: DNA polymerase III subunit gamma/tau [candidate division KSB3 bacterium]
MSYQVLTRKWRPQVFEDVIGQEHITDVLKNSLDSGKLHHGYLFSGIRGIGKTTTARIFARALNCVEGPTSQPCNHCEFCREIAEGCSMDVVEIDGASNRGVDDVRQLREHVSYVASRSRYNVFILDEVHMLTTEAFNALLKTLEEPPSNVVFVMATTEPWKVPATILSRCQQFKFKHSSPKELLPLLKKLARHEAVTISEDSLSLLAKNAGGSVRDAENFLDQVIAFCGPVVNDRDVRYVLGIPDLSLLDEVLEAILTHRTPHIFPVMERLASAGYNVGLFCLELMERIRNLMVLKVATHADRYLSLFDYCRADLEPFCACVSESELLQLYRLLVETEQKVRYAPNPRLVLEMSLTAMTKVQALAPLAAIREELQQIQAQLDQMAGKPAVKSEQTHHLKPSGVRPESLSENSAHEEPSEPLRSPVDLPWQDLITYVKEARPSLSALLKSGVPVDFDGRDLVIGFHQDLTFSKDALDDPKKSTLLAGILESFFGHPINISTTIYNGATSLDLMKQELADPAAAMPRPASAGRAQSAQARPASRSGRRSVERRSSERISRTQGHTRNRSGRDRQAPPKRPQYQPSVQVSVQDLIRAFDGEIEE